MKNFVLFAALLLTATTMACEESDGGDEEQSRSLRIVATELWPELNRASAEKLAQFDEVIVHNGNLFTCPSCFKVMKEANPRIKIYLYLNPWESYTEPHANQPFDNSLADIVKKRPQYYLSQPNGQGVIFWERMQVMDMTSNCPIVDGETYTDMFLRLAQELIFSQPAFQKYIDGLYIDNVKLSISWLREYVVNSETPNEAGIDLNRDGVQDSGLTIDLAWRQSQEKFYSQLLAMIPGKTMLGNTVDEYYDQYFVGSLFENFPNTWLGDSGYGGWLNTLKICENKPGIIHIENEKDLMFGICSALLVDAALSLGQHDAQFFPEYNINLGKAKGPMVDEGDVFVRYFRKGQVLVDPRTKRGEIRMK